MQAVLLRSTENLDRSAVHAFNLSIPLVKNTRREV